MPAPMIPVKNHPGVYKRSNRYVIRWRDRGVQRKQSFRTLKEAWAAKNERNTGDTQAESNQRFDDYAVGWLESYRGRAGGGLADSTRENYRRSIEQWAIPFFGNRRMRDIRARDVRTFVTQMERNANPPTIRKNMAALKVLFATAAEDGAIKANPALGVRVPGAAPKHQKAKAMTREELGLVLAAMPTEWQPFFSFLAQTGLRISEALGLTWDDVDLGTKPDIKVRRQRYRGEVKELKTASSVRSVPLSAGMAATLAQLRAQRYGGQDAPLWATKRGTPLDSHNLRRQVMRPVVRDLGLRWVGFHTFRHTCASLLFAHGKDIKQVQTWLGHADPGFTLRTYVHLLDEGLGDADFFDAEVSAAPTVTI